VGYISGEMRVSGRGNGNVIFFIFRLVDDACCQ
jgi:hypothetical protein